MDGNNQKPTLVFSSGTGWFHLAVQWATLSRIDHVCIGIGDFLLHARDAGVVIEPRASWFIDGKQKFQGEFEIVPDVSQGLAEAARHVGQPYDHLGIGRALLGIVWNRGLSAFTLPLGTNTGAQTCSTLALMLDPDGRIPEWRGLARGAASPVDLYRTMSGPSFRRILQPFRSL